MSIYNNNQDVYFDTNSSNIDKFIDSTSVSSKTNDTPVNIGGDGRLNQIYLSLWATKHEIERPKLEEVRLYASKNLRLICIHINSKSLQLI